MKLLKILSVILLFSLGQSFINTASAQSYIDRKAKDSVAIETKYVYFNNIKKGTTGFQLTAIKKSGTAAGTVTLERRIDTLPTLATAVWKQVGTQSFTITNVSTPQGDIFPVSVLDGQSYRIKVVGTDGVTYIHAASIRWQ